MAVIPLPLIIYLMRPLLKFSIPSVEVLTSEVTAYMLTHYLRSKITIRSYYAVWRKLEKYMVINGIDCYEPWVGKKFLNDRFGLLCDCSKLSTSEKNFIRSIKILSEYQSGGHVKPLRQKIIFKGEIGILMQEYLNLYKSRRLSTGAIDRCERTLYRFFCFLKEHDIESVNNISSATILLYFRDFDVQVKSLVQNAVSTLKSFFNYLFEQELTDLNLSRVVPRHNIRVQPKLPSTYTKDEIEKLLQSIDRGSGLGKRNYAILLIAVRLGLRASDIAGLKFENILWDKNLIELHQCKTDKRIELPLLAEIGNAVIDYLKHVRPESSEPFVFLRSKAPFTRLDSSALTSIVHKSLVHAEINIETRRHGAHALRHSLANSLLEKGTILPVISEVLGHGSTESTKYYLRIDVTSLSRCALDVPVVSPAFYAQKGGVFYV